MPHAVEPYTPGCISPPASAASCGLLPLSMTKKKIHDNYKAETIICMQCSYLFPLKDKTVASYDCPYCLRRKPIPLTNFSEFDKWYREDGKWGVPEAMAEYEVLEMLILDSLEAHQ